MRIPKNEKGEWIGPKSLMMHGSSFNHGKGIFTISHDRKRFSTYDAGTNRIRTGAIGGTARPGVKVGEGYDYCYVSGRD